MPELRPVPADFTENAKVMGFKALRKHYRVGAIVLRRWLNETGAHAWGAHNRPAPADFAEMAAILPHDTLCTHYRARRETVLRWYDETGVKRIKAVGWNRRPLPEDFAINAMAMTKKQLGEHYRASSDTVNRWIEESGASPQVYVPPFGRVRNLTPRALGVQIRKVSNSTIHDDAAEDLRRDRWAVFRCDEKGRYCAGGDFWRVGNVVCTPEELLERAERVRRRAA